MSKIQSYFGVSFGSLREGADLDPRAETGSTVGWNRLLIELFWPKWLQEGLNETLAYRAELTLWQLKQIFLMFSALFFFLQCNEVSHDRHNHSDFSTVQCI